MAISIFFHFHGSNFVCTHLVRDKSGWLDGANNPIKPVGLPFNLNKKKNFGTGMKKRRIIGLIK